MIRLSSQFEVKKHVTMSPPVFRLAVFISSISRTSTTCPAKTHLPVLHRPVIGVTVSLVGRHSHDYYQDSVTLGVSTRRPSRLPYAVNVKPT